jgi:TonB family protein
MFDFAIGHYQKHPPSRRMLTSYGLSVLTHIASVLILIRYPELLKDGVHIFPFRAAPAPAFQEQKWRNLAVISSKMEMPPIDEIKKNLYDWDRTKKGEATHAPIRINLPTGVIDDTPAAPRPKAEPLTIPSNLAGLVPGALSPVTGGSATAGDLPLRTTPVDVKKPTTAGVSDAMPKQIPKGIGDPGSLPTTSNPTPGTGTTAKPGTSGSGTKEAKDPGQKVSAQGPVFFDTQGFNLDDFATLVRERIKQLWEIPSNLRAYQGNATIIFYITKDGQVFGAKIEVSSGNGSLDLSALKAILDASPFPALPRGFPAERVGARLVFAYNER